MIRYMAVKEEFSVKEILGGNMTLREISELEPKLKKLHLK